MGKHHCIFSQFDSFQVNKDIESHYIFRYLWMDHTHLSGKKDVAPRCPSAEGDRIALCPLLNNPF